MTKYRIDRSIPGGFHDHLHTFCPEYAGLPTFRGVHPLLFDTLEAAEAVADHLRVWFPSTNELPGVARSLPITYSVVELSPTITSVKSETAYGSCTLTALFSDFSERRLFSFYIDELCFSTDELIGLTEAQAHELRHSKDVAYLRS